MTTAPARRKPQTWGELGAAMKALPNEAWRDFVYEFVTNPNPKTGGGKAAAWRAAGFGQGSTPTQQAKDAWKLAHDDRVIAAMAEEARKMVRVGHPGAVNELLAIMYDREGKAADRLRAIDLVLSRSDPVETRHSMEVVHKVIDPDVEALEELRAARSLGASPDKLRELFGGNGLARLERLEAAENARRAVEAKVIDGEAIEIEPETETGRHRPSGPPAENTLAATPRARVEATLADAEPDPEMLDDL